MRISDPSMPRVGVAGRDITKSKFFRATEKTRELADLGDDIPLVVQLGRGTKTYRVTRVEDRANGRVTTGQYREPTYLLEGQRKPVRQIKVFEARRSWADRLDSWYTNITLYLVLELRARGHGLDQLNALILQTTEINGTEQWTLDDVKKAVKFLWPRSKNNRTEDELRLDLWHYGPNGKVR